MIGTQKIQRAVRLYVTNLSDQEKALKVVERVPGERGQGGGGVCERSAGGEARCAGWVCDLGDQARGGADGGLSVSYRIECGARVVI